MAKYPKLVRKAHMKTPITVVLESDELTNLGEPKFSVTLQKLCNFQDGTHKVLTAEQQIIEASGTALFDGDIAPDMAVIGTGYVVVFGEKRRIIRGSKNRNPDGTVNYSRLDVM